MSRRYNSTYFDKCFLPLNFFASNAAAQFYQEGKFPDKWKESIVCPILKKGDPQDTKNYRPISCLVTASKVLEKIVCDQFTDYLEKNKLLPENQHGFRAHRSTATALTAMQKEWAANTEEGLITGILIWDLSAAYDTVNTELLYSKIMPI